MSTLLFAVQVSALSTSDWSGGRVSIWLTLLVLWIAPGLLVLGVLLRMILRRKRAEQQQDGSDARPAKAEATTEHRR